MNIRITKLSILLTLTYPTEFSEVENCGTNTTKNCTISLGNSNVEGKEVWVIVNEMGGFSSYWTLVRFLLKELNKLLGITSN